MGDSPGPCKFDYSSVTSLCRKEGREPEPEDAYLRAIAIMAMHSWAERHRCIANMEMFGDPEIGDLVCEVTSVWDASKDRMRLGIFENYMSSVVEGEEDAVSGELMWDTFWHIRTLEGKLVKWNDCQFVRLPMGIFNFGDRRADQYDKFALCSYCGCRYMHMHDCICSGGRP